MNQARVGLIGCGHISSAHLKGWQRARRGAVRGVFDLDRTQAAQQARRFGVSKVYESTGELLADCDVADICTPPQSHAQILSQALEAGVDVLIEKPVVVELAHWQRLRPLIDASGCRLTVVHNLKFTPMIQQVKQWIDGNRIGNVLRLDWRFLTSPESDRMLVGPRHWSHRLPGGRWFETLPHNLYLIHYLVGPLELQTTSVLQTGKVPHAVAADEVCVVLANDATMATIHYSASCRVNRREATIVGSDGVIDIDILGGVATLSRFEDTPASRVIGRSLLEAAGGSLLTLIRRPSFLMGRALGRSPHALVIAAFDRHLAGHGPDPTPIDEIDYVIRYCDLIGRAIDDRIAEAGRSSDYPQ